MHTWPKSLPEYKWPANLMSPGLAIVRAAMAGVFHAARAIGLLFSLIDRHHRDNRVLVIRTDGLVVGEGAGMFVLKRLDDIKCAVELSDFSIRAHVAGDLKETSLRHFIATELNRRSLDRYAPTQEAEIDEAKRPDLRVENNHITGPIQIEIKWAENWTVAKLLTLHHSVLPEALERPNELLTVAAEALGGENTTPDNLYVLGTFRLADDEALTIEFTPPGTRYWNVSIENIWHECLDTRRRNSSVTNAGAAVRPDGTVRTTASDTGMIPRTDPSNPPSAATSAARSGRSLRKHS